MNDNAALVVAALRSGDYQQDTGSLRTQNGFCCLGVVCDVYHRETGLGTWVEPGAHSMPDHYAFVTALGTDHEYEEKAILPPDVMEWVGFKTHSGRFDDGRATTRASWPSIFRPRNSDTLFELNDNGASFAEIADVIETFPGLFA